MITDIAHGEVDLDTLKAGASLIPVAKITKVPKIVKAIGDVGKTGFKKGKEGEKIAKSGQAKQTKAKNKGGSGAGESGSKPKNVFPENPDDLLPEIPRNKVTKANGTTSQTIQTSDNIRIRAEQHPLLPGETYNPRHHGVHYHVEYKVNPIKGWNNKNNVKKCYPEGYIPGAGSGFIPGETFPE